MTQSQSEISLSPAERRWRDLHKEARRRYGELAPRRFSTPILLGVLGAAFILLIGGFWAINQYYFQPQEATRQAKATEASLSLAQQATRDKATQDAVATAEKATQDAVATADKVGQDARATAEKATENAIAAAEQAERDATATAAAQELDVRATAIACQNIQLYTVTVALEPQLAPEPGTIHVVGSPAPRVAATWRVTNTGQCDWESVALKPMSGGDAVPTSMSRAGEPVTSVAPGETVEVELAFSPQAAQRVDGEWVLVVNGLSLFDQPHLRLAQEGWIVLVTPTATSTPTFTPTPTPTFTPVPVLPPASCSGVAPRCQGGQSAVCDNGTWVCQ